MTAAIKLFAEGGYETTSVAAIAKEAGIATQTVYASMGSKGEIAIAVSTRLGEVVGIDELRRDFNTAGAEKTLAAIAAIRRRICDRGGLTGTGQAANARRRASH